MVALPVQYTPSVAMHIWKETISCFTSRFNMHQRSALQLRRSKIQFLLEVGYLSNAICQAFTKVDCPPTGLLLRRLMRHSHTPAALPALHRPFLGIRNSAPYRYDHQAQMLQ